MIQPLSQKKAKIQSGMLVLFYLFFILFLGGGWGGGYDRSLNVMWSFMVVLFLSISDS